MKADGSLLLPSIEAVIDAARGTGLWARYFMKYEKGHIKDVYLRVVRIWYAPWRKKLQYSYLSWNNIYGDKHDAMDIKYLVASMNEVALHNPVIMFTPYHL